MMLVVSLSTHFFFKGYNQTVYKFLYDETNIGKYKPIKDFKALTLWRRFLKSVKYDCFLGTKIEPNKGYGNLWKLDISAIIQKL